VDGLSWRIAITHTTTHRYAREVFHSYNEARLVPQTLSGQICLQARVDVEPHTQLSRYTDYWGSIVDSFDIHLPHSYLRVTSRSTVETSSAPAFERGISWGEISSEAVLDRYAEFMHPTTLVPEFDAVADEVRALSPALPSDAALLTVEWVRDKVLYESGVTDVTTPADEALSRGKGVCQDFAHLTLGILRSLRIPCRYVSGYLHPSPDSPIGETVEGQGHAWVEWWCGEWVAWDPTHGNQVGDRYVLAGRGRDYADVPPLKGIYQGAPSVAHEVMVAITRTA
jgi:transglutaminase-like putative cysteine protease